MKRRMKRKDLLEKIADQRVEIPFEMTVAEALELGELLEGQESNFALRLMTDIAWVLSDRLTDAMIIESQKKGRGKR